MSKLKKSLKLFHSQNSEVNLTENAHFDMKGIQTRAL